MTYSHTQAPLEPAGNWLGSRRLPLVVADDLYAPAFHTSGPTLMLMVTGSHTLSQRPFVGEHPKAPIHQDEQ